jgi:membrane protein DedA with SNARE-associated domain
VLGTFLWMTVLAGAGYLLADQYRAVSAWLDPVATFVLLAVVLVYVYRVWTYVPEQHPAE